MRRSRGFRLALASTLLLAACATDAPASFSRLELTRHGGMGYCPEVGALHTLLSEHLVAPVRLTVSGSYYAAGDEAAGDPCLEGTAPAGVCVVDASLPSGPLSAGDGARLVELVGALGPGMCELDPACDPCLMTVVDVDGVVWPANDCVEPSAACASVDRLVSFLDSLVP